MLRLLALVAVSSALPQYGFYDPLARAAPFQVEYPQDEATARYLINFGVFQRRTATFSVLDSAAVKKAYSPDTVAHTVAGDLAFYQNPFTGNNSKYRVTIKSMAAGTSYVVMLQSDCKKATTGGTTLKSGTAPSFQLLGAFNVRGSVTTHNIDGAGSKKKVTDNYVVVRKTSSTGDVIGCTAAKLA